jgi:hypothetical protein
MRLWLLRNRARALLGLAPLPPRDGAAVPPVPRVVVRMGRTSPGVLVRLAPGVLALVVAGLAGCADGWWVLAAAGAVWLVVRPMPQVAAAYVGIAAIWLAADGNRLAADPVTGAVPGVGPLAALVLAVHVLVVATSLAGHVGWTTLVEVAVLGRAARSVAGAQAVAQSVLLLVAWVRTGLVGNLEVLRGVAVLAVVAAVALLVPREWIARRRPRRPQD